MKQPDSAIARLYGGPLEDFVRQRDLLAKELRGAGNREAAAEVKALPKPSRTAWALNLAASQPENVRPLDAAVAATLEAQASGGDVRSALVSLREAVREFAGHAARAAERAGHGLETGVLVNAVLALLGTTDSLDALRRGRLAEVPDAGGLDFLAMLRGSLPVPERLRPSAHSAPPSGTAPEASRPASALADARARSEHAREALRDAESRLRLAEDRLRKAEADATAARREYDRARIEAESAAAQIARLEQGQRSQ
jgi:hypothetical protein